MLWLLLSDTIIRSIKRYEKILKDVESCCG